MEPICKRAFHRNSQEARILYADYTNLQQTMDAVMFNTSEGGMYFESKESLQPGSDIWIKIPEIFMETHGMEAYNGYRAEVMWCLKMFNGDVPCYGVGVRFMVNICGQCGLKVAFSDIHKMENFLFLCSNCVEQLKSLPDGKIKECFENFLIGNVV